MLRQALHIILVPTLLLYSCSATEAENTANGADTVKEKTYVEQLDKDSTEKIYAWQGNLDGKYPVLMWYKEQENVLWGSLFYTEHKNAGPIQIIGTINNNEYRILEMPNNGIVTGIWLLTPNFHGAEGEWWSPEGKRKYNASLMRIDTAVTIPNIEASGNLSGQYTYRWGKDGANGNMTVSHNKNKVSIRFDNVTAAPAYNMALMDDVVLELTGNQAVFQSDEHGECIFRIRFYNGFALVNYIDEKDDCGFGAHADVSGVYIKEK
jgi:hypothetical protein